MTRSGRPRPSWNMLLRLCRIKAGMIRPISPGAACPHVGYTFPCQIPAALGQSLHALLAVRVKRMATAQKWDLAAMAVRIGQQVGKA